MNAPIRSVLCVVGTRPEAIKLAPVILALRKRSDITTIVCATAQHRDLLDDVLAWFKIAPEYDLDLMTPNQGLADFASRALSATSEVLSRVQPDVVVVQGDTTTVAMASLAAFFHKIPVGHVEAGLRTYRRYDPFPEEMNRRLTASLASMHFAPTETAAAALRAEGIDNAAIHITGNTVVDALLMTLGMPLKLNAGFEESNRRLILVTAHRRENFGDRLEAICLALKDVIERNPDAEVVYPVHPNPSVRETVSRVLSDIPRIHLIAPLRYEQFAHLLSRAFLIVTDSGGIQEEAPVLGKPTLVLRDATERTEAIDAGVSRLIGTDRGRVRDEIERLLRDDAAYQRMARKASPFGDGHAAERIVRVLTERGAA